LETRATAFLISPVIVTGFEQKHPKRAHSSHLPSWKDCFLRDRAKNKQKRFGRNKMRFGWKTTFAAMAVAFAIAPGAANAVDYKGKKITFIVPFKEGGGGSVYTRFLSPLFAKHLPGAPTAVVRNIPGGGSVKGANQFMRKAKPDGRVVFKYRNRDALQIPAQAEIGEIRPARFHSVDGIAIRCAYLCPKRAGRQNR
jgi:hypothetical protein